jgi:hypothetical protein
LKERIEQRDLLEPIRHSPTWRRSSLPSLSKSQKMVQFFASTARKVNSSRPRTIFAPILYSD